MEQEVIIANRYLIIRKLGEGGSSKVFLAHDQVEDRYVSLKILKKENIDERKIKKFQKEAATLALLDDENIVKIYDVGEDNDLHYIVTEYIDGMTLKEYIKECSPIPVEEIVTFSKQLLHGVRHAHNKGVVHKDLKSQNILLDEHRNIKITDFGIADIVDEDVTRTQSLMGTPQYIAPEILNNNELTPQSDLYSVGIMMYEMCVMQVPFVGEKPSFIMLKQMSQPLPSIVSQRSDIPQSLENIIIKATAKKLSNRYQSADEMLNDLDHVFDSDVINEKPLVLVDDLFKNDELETTIDVGNIKIDLPQVQDKAQKQKKAKSKQQKIIIISIISIVILLGLFFFTFFKNSKIEVPDLTNKTQSEALNELQLLGIDDKNISIKYEYNKDVEQDKIISTKPPHGDKISKKTPIIIIISQGPERKKLDNYIGQVASDIKAQLEKEGFKVVLNYTNNDAKKDTIIGQDPGSGSFLKPGDTITLEVSSGKQKIKVPNFTNMNKSEVDKWAKENQISITYETTCNNTVALNHIISQSISYNSEINPGEQIAVSISNGVCPTPSISDNQNQEGNNES